MKTQKKDRRSLRTRQLLTKALVELMAEQRYDSITVQDILNRADVGRSTFYLHYQDKEDLLVSSLEQMMDRFVQHIEVNGQLMVSTEMFFQHVKDNEHLYRALVWGRGIDLFFQQGQIQLSRRIEEHLEVRAKTAGEPAVPLTVVATYLSGAFLTLVKWWIENKMVYSPRQMSEMYQRLAMSGTMPAVWPDAGEQNSLFVR